MFQILMRQGRGEFFEVKTVNTPTELARYCQHIGEIYHDRRKPELVVIEQNKEESNV